MTTPKVILRFSISLDGYLNDTSPERLILSNTEDFALVDQLRSECDAILVGAETIRADNPSLRIKSEQFRQEHYERTGAAELTRICLTNSGNLPIKSKFFANDTARKIIFCPQAQRAKLNALETSAEVLTLGEQNGLIDLTTQLQQLGCQQLLVEGGATIISQFLNLDLVDEMIISIAPVILGAKGSPHFIDPNLITKNQKRPMSLIKTSQVGEMALLHYRFETI